MLVIGVAGTELTATERQWLQHRAVAGVILFARNFASRQQVTELTAAIRAASPRPLLVCVDQEGGRVQRFRDGFSALPPLQQLAQDFAVDAPATLARVREHAWLMASEIRATGLDLSFAPVADLGHGNLAIGNRAFHADPQVVAQCLAAYVAGMHEAGMPATLKHFPGHGTVREDTHVDIARDERPLAQLRAHDLVPFAAGIAAGADAVMMAHVVYPQVDAQPAGCSARWINEVLRGELGFRGVVVSDDIGMAASFQAGGVAARVHAHLDAGCDLVLACHPELVEAALEAVQDRALNTAAVAALLGRGALGWGGLLADSRHSSAQSLLFETLGRTV